MKAMVCEMCNSNDIQKQDGVYVCQSCGTKYSVEEAKKLFVEGTVKIDRSEEAEKLLILARRARDEDNSANAEKYYGMVLQEDPDNWEAAFFQVYFQAMQCKIMNISSAAHSVTSCIGSAFDIISKLEDTNEQDEAISTLIIHSMRIANLLANAAKNHYLQYPTVSNAKNECISRVVATVSILDRIESRIKALFPNKTDTIANFQSKYNQFISDFKECFDVTARTSLSTRLTNEIKTYYPNYEAPNVSTGGCYVATAVYGSYDCPEVWTLRRYRDYTLAETWYGRAFIRTYYVVSPTLVKWFGKTEWFKNMWKPTLDKMVKKLNNNGVDNTAYNDREW